MLEVWVHGNEFGTGHTPLSDVIGKRAHSTALMDFVNSLLSKSFVVQVSYWTDVDVDHPRIMEAVPACIYNSVAVISI